MVVVQVPVDWEVESYLETSLTISNFVERYHAAQHGALDEEELRFKSQRIRYIPHRGTDTMGRNGYADLNVWLHLNHDVS